MFSFGPHECSLFIPSTFFCHNTPNHSAGNRIHQKSGRSIAYFILEALKEALKTWDEAENQILKDEDWHVTAMYDKQRDGVANLADDKGFCNRYSSKENFSTFISSSMIRP